MSERITPDEEYDDTARRGGSGDPVDEAPLRESRSSGRPVRTKSTGTGAVLPIVLILIGAVGLVIAWGTLQDKHGTSNVAGASGLPTDSPSPSPSTPSPSLSPSPSTTASGSPSPTKSPSPSKSSSPSTSGTPSPTTSPTQPSPGATSSVGEAQKISVIVFNATPRKGLAGAAAAYLKSKGWTVPRVDNWTGKPITKTTIFYPSGKADEARRLATFVRGDVVLVLAPSNLPSGVFVLVMANNYPA